MDIGVGSNGHLFIESGEALSSLASKMQSFFPKRQAAGLLYLLRKDRSFGESLGLSYWYEFSATFLKEQCTNGLQSEGSNDITESLSQSFLNSRPPMKGGEYLDRSLLSSLWQSMHKCLVEDLQNHGGTWSKFLEKNYPRWSQVGCLHFHLAEREGSHKDPFAFLATYTTRVSEKARLQHVTLGQAINEATSMGRKESLLSLLKPLQEAFCTYKKDCKKKSIYYFDLKRKRYLIIL